MRMNLRNLLRRQCRETLELIIRHRELENENVEACTDTQLIDFINTTLKKDDQIKHYLHSLSPQHRRLFDFIAFYGGEVPETAVVEKIFGGDRERYVEVMHHLSIYCLAFRDETSHAPPETRLCWIPEQYLKFILVPRFAVKRLSHLLKQSSMGQLKSIAFDGLGLKARSASALELITHIASQLLEPKNLEAHLTNLPYAKKVFIQLLVEVGGEADVEDLRLSFAQTEGLDNRHFDDVVEDLLWKEGFLFLEDVGHRNVKCREHARVVSIPIEVYCLMRNKFKPMDLTPAGLYQFLLTSDLGETVLEEQEFDIVHNLIIFLGYIANTEPQVLKKGGLRKNIFDNICTLLDRELPKEYLEFIIMFCEQTGLIRDQDGFWSVSQKAVERLKDPWALLCHLTTFWSDNPRWAPAGDGAGKSSKVGTAASHEVFNQNRTFLSHLLFFCPWDEPFHLGEYFDLLFDKTSLLPNAVTSSNAMYNTCSVGLANLTRDELDRVFRGVLRWLGIIQMGQAGEGQDVVRMTPLGTALLGYQPIPEEFTARHAFENTIEISENGEIKSPPRLSPDVFLALCRFARLTSCREIITLRIDRDSLRFGLDRGLKSEEIKKTLRKISTTDLPEAVEQLIDECSSKHGEIEIGPAGGYLLAHDAATLQELRNHKILRESFLDVGNEHLVLLGEGIEIDRLVKDLRKKGYMPLVAAPKTVEREHSFYRFALPGREVEFLAEILRLVRSLAEETELEFNAEELDHLEKQILAVLPENADRYRFHDSFMGRFEQFVKKQRFAEHPQSTGVLPTTIEDPEELDAVEYHGPNPADSPEGVLRLLRYATKRGLRTRIYYALSEEQDNLLIDIIVPSAFADENLVAHCCASKTSRDFLIERITRAELMQGI
jgi:hypothetical protein